MTKLAIIVILFDLSLLSWNACDRLSSNDGNRHPVMEVAGQTLYQEDIDGVMPAGYSAQDSAIFTQKYMYRWAVNALLYDKASNNVDMREINRSTEQFRRDLIINKYKHSLVEGRMQNVIEDSIASYYSRESKRFPLKEAVLKGVFLKVPANTKTNQLESWLGNLSDDNLDKIMRYCTQYALDCKFFNDTWTYSSEISSQMPKGINPRDPNLTSGVIVQTNENEIYYLRICDVIAAGQPMPLELASYEIRNILLNRQKNKIILDFENNLYNEAVKDERIKIFN